MVLGMFSSGEMVLLMDERGRKYLIRLEDKKFNTSLGELNLSDLLGKEPGTVISSHLGREFVALRPSIADYLQKLRRAPQIVLPKDAAQIIARTGVGPGSVVVDGGTGSGSLAIFLANLVRPSGHVYTYEVRKEFAELARRNVVMVGLSDFVTIKLKDISLGIDERGVDLITLDIPKPELAIPHAEEALKAGGYLFVFSPCIEPVQRVYEALREHKFRDLQTIECLVRELEVKPGATRPSTRMIAHTGYMTFARKV
jgi:tRNA (adenine57-N1/adenine58-N1)-methyltransferase